MNAVKDILEKANLMVDELIKVEDERLTDIKNGYIESLNGEEPTTKNRYRYSVDSINKMWGMNLSASEISRHRDYRRDYDKLNQDLFISINEKGRKDYFELMRQTNLDKLGQSIAKHGITDNMKADKVELKSGKKGLEIHADIDGKKFITFATLAGGYIQRYHYRYRSSFK
jgi:hypothetical protein